MVSPEAQARGQIDAMLASAGWHVCDFGQHDITRPCATREFPLKSGHGLADYLAYLEGKAAGVVKGSKPRWTTLNGAYIHSEKYATSLPLQLQAWERTVLFSFESTAMESQLTKGLGQESGSRRIFDL